MTETTNTPHQQPAPVEPELSGVDLARVALHAAKEAARARGEQMGIKKTPKRRVRPTVRRDGREPTGFAAVLQGLMADRAWDVPAAGGTVLDRWPDIAASLSPKLPDHVQAVAFHPETGQLDLRPDSPAYATQLRLISARIVATANHAAGTDAVHTVRVLPAGAAPEPCTVQPAPAAATEPGAPVKARESASVGFRQALAAHQAARPERYVDAGIAQAVERQTRAMRELSARAFPETEVGSDDQPAPIEVARVQRRREADTTHALALRRARAERAQRVDTASDAPHAPLVRRTA
ncbi:DciA family protein [Streptomyces sp. NPDC056704]|uniref:DciA family protein n=1 Tax=Streptomyces sp. NPDC056704 TaxID=3345917 RepID=UPI0036C4E4D7